MFVVPFVLSAKSSKEGKRTIRVGAKANEILVSVIKLRSLFFVSLIHSRFHIGSSSTSFCSHIYC